MDFHDLASTSVNQGVLTQVAQIAAVGGIVFTVVQYWMRTMIPLRVVGISTNVLFLIYSSLGNI